MPRVKKRIKKKGIALPQLATDTAHFNLLQAEAARRRFSYLLDYKKERPHRYARKKYTSLLAPANGAKELLGHVLRIKATLRAAQAMPAALQAAPPMVGRRREVAPDLRAAGSGSRNGPGTPSRSRASLAGYGLGQAYGYSSQGAGPSMQTQTGSLARSSSAPANGSGSDEFDTPTGMSVEGSPGGSPRGIAEGSNRAGAFFQAAGSAMGSALQAGVERAAGSLLDQQNVAAAANAIGNAPSALAGGVAAVARPYIDAAGAAVQGVRAAGAGVAGVAQQAAAAVSGFAPQSSPEPFDMGSVVPTQEQQELAQAARRFDRERRNLDARNTDVPSRSPSPPPQTNSERGESADGSVAAQPSLARELAGVLTLSIARGTRDAAVGVAARAQNAMQSLRDYGARRREARASGSNEPSVSERSASPFTPRDQPIPQAGASRPSPRNSPNFPALMERQNSRHQEATSRFRFTGEFPTAHLDAPAAPDPEPFEPFPRQFNQPRAPWVPQTARPFVRRPSAQEQRMAELGQINCELANVPREHAPAAPPRTAPVVPRAVPAYLLERGSGSGYAPTDAELAETRASAAYQDMLEAGVRAMEVVDAAPTAEQQRRAEERRLLEEELYFARTGRRRRHGRQYG